CSAYGAYIEGQLAHVCWLIYHEQDRLLPIRNAKLRSGEAEITHAHTLEAFRGRGIYGSVIQKLCNIAADAGITKLYMLASTANQASIRGIEKAGLMRCGEVRRHKLLPRLKEGLVVTFRGHRTSNRAAA